MKNSTSNHSRSKNVNHMFEGEGILEEVSQPLVRPTRKSAKSYQIITENENSFSEASPVERKQLISSTKEKNFTSVGYNPFTAEDKKKQQLTQTFMHMEFRKLKRSSSGSYRDNPRGSLWGISYFLVFAGYITYQFYYMQQDQEWDSASIWKEVILETLLTIVLSYASVRMQTFANSLTLFWIYILVTGFFLLEQNTFRYLFIADFTCLLFTWIGHIIYYYIGPYILRESRYCFGWRRVKSRLVQYDEKQPISVVGLENKDIREVVFEYRPLTKVFTCSSPNTFIYRGEWKDGRPSGWGEWRDDSFYGECLSGYWENGIPRGPFDSVERGTGNVFTSVAIGYCSMRNDDWKCQPFKELSHSLTYGMAYEECPVSGAYYLNFPIHTELKNLRYRCEDSCTDGMAKILPHMDHALDKAPQDSVIVTASPYGIEIRGYEQTGDHSHLTTTIEFEDSRIEQKDEESEDDQTTCPQLKISGWELSTNPEVLIFIHGYNIPLDWAMKKLAQLVAAGKFPSNVKPFVFSWPTGKIFYYFQSVKVATSESTMHSFHQFLTSIIAAGVQNVHIVTHSMGIRLFMRALRTPSIFDLFSNIGQRDASNVLNLATATFTNADYAVKEFRNNDYERLKQLCENISFYVDKYDDALKYASTFTRKMLIGSLAAPFYSSSSAVKLLDVDIIDTSGLQDNMHSVRHSAFNVNRMMVEDLREIVVSRKRAKERLSRLVNKKGNLFCFMTTPAAVNGNIV